MATIDNYADNPWEEVTENQRQWYDPLLRSLYRKKAVFGQYTTFKINLAGVSTTRMTITQLMDLHPNSDAIGSRTIWLNNSHFDSQSVDVVFDRFAGKVAYHEFDEIISYWKEDNKAGMAKIVQGKLGLHMVDVMDLLSRNAILSAPYKMYGGNATDFDSLAPGDKITTELIDLIHLGMQNRDVPYASDPSGNVGTIICITSPGVFFDLQQQSSPKDWINKLQYTRPTTLLNYEVGLFRNVRFVVTPKATLYNAGHITHQAEIAVLVNAGDGALGAGERVDEVWKVGQSGATPYITVDDETGFVVNDIVTIHVDRVNHGAANMVDYTDGKLHNRRIVKIDTVLHRIMLDKPIMEDFTTDLGGGVFGYVTKAVHIHASMFIGGPDGVVQGVARPPRFTAPPPIDDTQQVFRFAWNAYQGYNVYNPNVIETVFTTGTFRQVGTAIAG